MRRKKSKLALYMCYKKGFQRSSYGILGSRTQTQTSLYPAPTQSLYLQPHSLYYSLTQPLTIAGDLTAIYLRAQPDCQLCCQPCCDIDLAARPDIGSLLFNLWTLYSAWNLYTPSNLRILYSPSNLWTLYWPSNPLTSELFTLPQNSENWHWSCQVATE